MDPDTPPAEPAPSAFNYILSFILVGIAWGFTTPFIRRAAVDFNKRQEETNRLSSATNTVNNDDDDDNTIPAQPQRGGFDIKKKISAVFWTVVNLLRTPAYAIPLVVNLTGSVWFFLLVGKHGMSFCFLGGRLKHRFLSELMLIFMSDYRTLVDSPHIEFNGLLVHGARGMVRGTKSDCEGDVVGYVPSPRRYSAVRTFKNYCLIISMYIINVYMYSDEIVLELKYGIQRPVYIIRQYNHSNQVNIHSSSARKENTHSEPCARMGIISRTNHQPRIMVSTSWSKRKESDISKVLHSRNNNQCSESSCMVEMTTGIKNTTPGKLRSKKET